MHEFFSKYQIDDEVIAAGVSGGADSLALVFRIHEWAESVGKKIVALTVNHGLRPEAAAEADYVAELMKQARIEHHILIWEGKKPTSDIEAVARNARYGLMADWCQKHDIHILATGHHRRDQAETFLLRLARGSGLYGLSGILPLTQRCGLTIIRPQLNDSPEELRSYLQKRKIKWVEDASNQDDCFDRVKIRKYLKELEQKIGLTEARLAETAAVLGRTRAFMEEETEAFITNHARWWCGVVVCVSWYRIQNLHSEMAFRILSRLINVVGCRTYAPEADEMFRLLEQLKRPEFKSCTLGDCEIILSRGKLWIVPELKIKKVLSRTIFAAAFPQFAHADLPYKVKLALYEDDRMKNGKKSKK